MYLPTWSWWQRAAISGRAVSFPTHSGHSLGRSSMETAWTLRKMNKAALARQKQVLPTETITEPSVTIIDGMSLVQKMKGNDQTFSQHADSALTHILHEGVRNHRIDVVFDTYREDSIKNAEISNRHIFQNMVPYHRIQQWRNLLAARPTS